MTSVLKFNYNLQIYNSEIWIILDQLFAIPVQVIWRSAGLATISPPTLSLPWSVVLCWDLTKKSKESNSRYIINKMFFFLIATEYHGRWWSSTIEIYAWTQSSYWWRYSYDEIEKLIIQVSSRIGMIWNVFGNMVSTRYQIKRFSFFKILDGSWFDWISCFNDWSCFESH